MSNCVQYPDNDSIDVIDNEQVIRYCRSLDSPSVSSTSVITMTGFVELGDTELQKDISFKPPCIVSLAIESNVIDLQESSECVDPKLQEVKTTLVDTCNLMLKDDGDYLRKLETIHQEQFLLVVEETIHVLTKMEKCRSSSSNDDDVTGDEYGEDSCTCMDSSYTFQGSKQSHDGYVLNFDACEGEHDMEVSVEDQEYGHVQSFHKGAKKLLITDPASFKNPNSFANLTEVLREIGKRNGIDRYGGRKKKWSIICVDGLPYVLIHKLKMEAVLCETESCGQSFMSKKEFIRHHSDAHPSERVHFVYEFDWLYLHIGAGHYEHNLLKSFIHHNWVPVFEHVCDLLKFKSTKAKAFVKSANDHHLSWKLLLLYHECFLKELIHPYMLSIY